MIPNIPRFQPPTNDATAAPVEPAFTVADALAWLGISLADYEAACNVLRGRHGGPFVGALLDARAAQGTDVTAIDVLNRHGIDPANPVAAAVAYDKGRSAYDDIDGEQAD